ncbi:MAG: helix-turn-helix domain-containing protein [Flavobacteriales bacterium]
MIKTEKEYNAICERIEKLLLVVGNSTPSTDASFIELDLLSDLVVDFEEANYPIEKPTLIEVIKLRMYELDLNQIKLSALLGVSTSRVSEYLNGKSEPTLKVAREMVKKLKIEPEIVLGV